MTMPAEKRGQPIAMREFRVTIASTRRPAIIALPADATDGEIDEVAGWILTQVLVTYRQERQKAKTIILARSLPPKQ
jgi:hypothetical protein